MARSAREILSEAIAEYGIDGTLIVFHDVNDPCGTTAEGADLPPAGLEPVRPALSERVSEANARSRGERL